MAGENVVYGRKVNKLVAEIADNFTTKNCYKLCFMYEDLLPGSFTEKHGDDALRLLKRMRDKKVFSNDRLEKLADLMGELDLPQMKNRVDAFIEKNSYAISSMNIQQRPLPAVPIPCTSIGRSTSIECSPEICRKVTPATSQEDDDNYSVFFRHPPPLSASQKRQSFQSSRPSTQDSLSDDDIYSEPYTILKSVSKEHFPLHQEHMKLLVKPMREAILAGTEKVIVSEKLECSLPRYRSSYSLVISSGHKSSNPYISANLYLLPGSQLERKDHLMSQLRVRQRSKKQEKFPDIYSHSSLLTMQEGMLPVEEGALPVEEGTLPVEGTHAVQRVPPAPVREGKSHVASFPSIIGHEHFLNKELVSRPYITLIFTLTQYRQE